MKVKVLHKHANEYGVRDGHAEYDKEVGSEYEIADEADAQALVKSGLVSEVKSKASSAEKE